MNFSIVKIGLGKIAPFLSKMREHITQSNMTNSVPKANKTNLLEINLFINVINSKDS